MEIIIILALIVINGIFSMAEMSLVTAKKYKLEKAASENKSGAKAALKLSENPNKFLSTVQIGITLIGILLGIFSGDTLTQHAIDLVAQVPLLAPYAKEIGAILIVAIVTYASIVLGELIPKRLGMTFPEGIATLLAQPMQWLSVLTSPFVWLLTKSNDVVLKLLGIKHSNDDMISEEEIKSMVKQSAETGEIQEIEQDIVQRVFELGDTKVDHIFTHRNDVVYFTVNDTWDEIKDTIYKYKHSAYPVCSEDDIDTIIGIVLLKDLFDPSVTTNFDIKSVMRQILFINDNAYAYAVLAQFKQHRTHYGIVIDEYATVQGIVTMDDVMDALVGDVTDIDDEEYGIVQRTENTWLVDGQYNLKEFLKAFSIHIDQHTYEEYTTVAGLILSQTSELPKVGFNIQLGNYSFEVIDKDGQRIDKILLTKNEDEAEA